MKKEIDFKFALTQTKNFIKEDIIVQQGLHLGAKNRLTFKPDVSAPGKNIKSNF